MIKRYNTKEKGVLLTQRLNELIPELTKMDEDNPFSVLVLDNVLQYDPSKEFNGRRYIPIIIRDNQLSIPNQDIGFFPEAINMNIYIYDNSDQDAIEELFQLYFEKYNLETFDESDMGYIIETVGHPVFQNQVRSGDGKNLWSVITNVTLIWKTVKGYLSSFETTLTIDDEIYQPLSVTYAQIKDRDTTKDYNTSIENRYITDQSMTVILPVTNKLKESRLWRSTHVDTFNQIFLIEDDYGGFKINKEWELMNSGVTRSSGDLVLFSATFRKPLPKVDVEVTVITEDSELKDDPENPIIFTTFSYETNTASHLRSNMNREILGVGVRRGTSYSLQFIHMKDNPLSESLAYQSKNQNDNYIINIKYRNAGLEFEYNNLEVFGGSHGITNTGLPFFTLNLMEGDRDF